MTSNKLPKQRRAGFIKLIFLSLMLSFFILYFAAVCLWMLYGYENALSFFIDLLKANQVIVSELGESVLSHSWLSNFGRKLGVYLQNTNLEDSVQTLSQAGSDTFKDGLSTFFSQDFLSETWERSAFFFYSGYVLVLKAGFLFILILKIFFIKAFLLIAAIPLFALLGFVGSIDGLSQREIRRAELGRESSYLFHMFNKWVAKIIGFGLFAWVCMPATVNPQWFFIPLGLLFSMMLSLIASKFKKYL
jgi:integrating conjugative element membrane protein (TIGR03747 family)